MSNGIPIFTLAKKCIKGWYPISKGGDNELIPFIGLNNEEKLMYYVDYNPEIIHIERADIGDDFAERFNLKKSPLLPIVIEYEFEGKKHNYYPDFFIKLKSGETVIVEVGDRTEKMKKKALAKAKAAINYCIKNGWKYWFIMGDNIMTDTRKDNLVLLKGYDKSMYAKHDIQQDILEMLKDEKNTPTIRQIISMVGKKYSENETEMALYELINYAAKRGRLAFDLDTKDINKDSVFHIIPEESTPIIPGRIELSYEEIIEKYNSADDIIALSEPEVKITVLDTDEMTEAVREEFFKKRSAVLEVISITRKETISEIAKRYGITRTSLYRYVEKYMQNGDKGLLSYNSYEGKQSFMDKDICNAIIRIINKKPSWGATRLYESEEFRKALTNLAKKKNVVVTTPNYYQVYRFLKKYKAENSDELVNFKNNSKKGKVSDYGSFVRTIKNHLDVVQVDAHWLDIKITTKDRQRIAGRVWAIVFIDVKTSDIIGYSLSLKAPMEEDYMRALKCCIESKEALVKRHECENEWACQGIPRKIMSDNGKIFISKRSTDVLVRRLNIVEEVAPPYMPDVKGSIEALFTWIVNRLISKMPGYTKNGDRKENEKEVLQAGITFEELESMFAKSIVDVYNQEWDTLRGKSRFVLWMDAEKENRLGTPKWLGTKDELKLLLMKEEQKRKVDRHGVSFKGHFYQNKSMLCGLVGKHVSIRYDKMDISVIYIYLDDGSYYCEAYCNEFLGRRISVWELDTERKYTLEKKEICNQKPKKSMEKIQKYFKNRKQREREAQAEEQSRLYDTYDIHTDKVKKVVENTRGNGNVVDFVQASNIIEKNFKKLDTRKI